MLLLDDALSALRLEMTSEVVDDTRAFWQERGVTLQIDVDPEADPTDGLPEDVLSGAGTEGDSSGSVLGDAVIVNDLVVQVGEAVEETVEVDGEIVEAIEVEAVDPVDGPAGDLIRRRAVRTSRQEGPTGVAARRHGWSGHRRIPCACTCVRSARCRCSPRRKRSTSPSGSRPACSPRSSIADLNASGEIARSTRPRRPVCVAPCATASGPRTS